MATPKHMTWDEKVSKFINKNGQELFETKTPIEELPFGFQSGTSSHPPDSMGGISTNDTVLWCKFVNGLWFQPYGRFDQWQISEMIRLCKNDIQIIALMELLSATKTHDQ